MTRWTFIWRQHGQVDPYMKATWPGRFLTEARRECDNSFFFCFVIWCFFDKASRRRREAPPRPTVREALRADVLRSMPQQKYEATLHGMAKLEANRDRGCVARSHFFQGDVWRFQGLHFLLACGGVELFTLFIKFQARDPARLRENVQNTITQSISGFW